MKVFRLGTHQTVAFAAEELCRYINIIQPELSTDICPAECYALDQTGIWVGLAPEFDALLPDVPDRQLDDGIYMDVTASVGIITGTNPRSAQSGSRR